VSGLYELIGRGYAAGRRTDPRIAAPTWAAPSKARAAGNAGAGTGSYEPPGRNVVAVEPSAVMRAQRPPGAAHAWPPWPSGCRSPISVSTRR
jgi:hypothetical protein